MSRVISKLSNTYINSSDSFSWVMPCHLHPYKFINTSLMKIPPLTLVHKPSRFDSCIYSLYQFINLYRVINLLPRCNPMMYLITHIPWKYFSIAITAHYQTMYLIKYLISDKSLFQTFVTLIMLKEPYRNSQAITISTNHIFHLSDKKHCFF